MMQKNEGETIMVKVKSILLLLLLSLAFNIIHDLVLVDDHSHLHQARLLVLEVEDNSKHQHSTVDVHDIFHFSAIFTEFVSVKLASTLYEKLNFTLAMPTATITNNSFRPPIA